MSYAYVNFFGVVSFLLSYTKCI